MTGHGDAENRHESTQAVEEAIVNALLAATDMSAHGARVEAIGSERLLSAFREVGWKPYKKESAA
ncbi:hypothetical protein PQQ86_05655 [Paraburkholderia sediminicola]|uniref:hypothetical protein n=1 Tax=Paraburkholderia sediminicola TaxID=458836 RepID=UPI0038BD70BC